MNEFVPSLADDLQAVRWTADLLRLGSSPGADIAFRRMNLLVDVRDVLSTIRVPTLVVHKAGDRACLIHEGRHVAQRIPGAEFVELPGDDHVPWVGVVDRFFRTVQSFLDRVPHAHDPVQEPDKVLATVVFVRAPRTDPRSLAERAQTLAAQYRGLLGQIANLDGLIATFDGPSRAIRFADALSRASAGPDSGLCVGIDVGEVTTLGTQIRGEPLDTARALAAAAGPGQILTTGVVRGLAPGSGIRFEPVHGVPKIGGGRPVLAALDGPTAAT